MTSYPNTRSFRQSVHRGELKRQAAHEWGTYDLGEGESFELSLSLHTGAPLPKMHRVFD
jgi:hypothetical protein